MEIAIVSGKGGTGKTTIATTLARSLADQRDIWFIDCDVEAPNGHLFLNPEFSENTLAVIKIPQIKSDQCTLCGKCVEVCQFHALAKIGDSILVFPQLCHGCGSCTWNCPESAILEISNPIGKLQSGITAEKIYFASGELTISEPMATPVIRQLKKFAAPPQEAVVILDSPPGASCSVVETLRGADFALLVTEPTPFGLHDLIQIHEVVKDLRIPAGVVINRDGIGNNQVEDYLLRNHLPILLRIPFSKNFAAGIASGKTLVDIDLQFQDIFHKLFNSISELIKNHYVQAID